MTTITEAGFQDAIKAYLKRNDLTIAALALKINKSDRTVGDWIRLGIKRDHVRQRIVDEYPWLFERSDDGAQATSVTQTHKSVADDSRKRMLVLFKTELAHPSILYLSSVLAWFLFDATAEERNEFRDTLGDDWKQFLELTRAMTNETAFEVAKSEGRLEWCQP